MSDDDAMSKVDVRESLRWKLRRLARDLFWTAKRCEHSASGREVPPHMSTVLEAAWEVAQRHPDELMTALLRRTEARDYDGHVSTQVASGQRPR